MADILTTATTRSRRLKLPRLSFPRLAIGASLKAISGLACDALKMAYVDPYAGLGRQPQVAPDDDLEGRDPTW
ncbi:hypothetical protein EN828_22735 [Mesorhizobium sp. M2D.F.Ca.ET.185.01.1.1]|uniref:hypothetical protein n=1 Tax=unclassified Mesorhizobium TaxID=325217 RepID=UPI000FCB07E1|nr:MULTISPECIES: hypothetical protein [unclassified Mesorhizobium]TGP57219.1 hypothetical protein EN873_03765 [bacterium M00.F.Ca.ET.230.01.1.1]TGP77011.1 hypothetical protein EN870_20530 [bacterium M00.F.Ca.ET.227.01.1.1]TGP84862.1 hypothetical protein EN864_28210 [bacterium M00.F.Ca.ET.221.01.1.1]TGP88432.1 hypothetical protein EN865_27510 [bacterium M00.F.Ca.ET.222.01.1.1]TGT68668.1 hypothetical protein EN802_27665 [bacterium M00.F.Ca.ET.159.01.1.1]TGT80502.1 hypothetical protein EN800_270